MGALIVFLYLEFGRRLHPESALSFFLIVTCMKILQINNYRDFFLSILCLFLCLIGTSLFGNNITLMSFILTSIIVLTSLIGIKDIYTPQPTLIFSNLKKCFKLIFLASPIAISLFLFFPRFKTFFPSVGQTYKGRIGYSKEVKNDQIAELSTSDQIAFRASLNKKLSNSDLYWRGRVLDQTDGYNWNSRYMKFRSQTQDKNESKGYRYSVKLEQNFHGDLFTLDYGQEVNSKETNIKKSFLDDNVFQLYGKNKLINYTATSDISKPASAASNIKNYLRLPTPSIDIDPKKVFNIGTSPNTNTITQNLIKYLSEYGFKYSLKPGKMKSLPDLINNKKGFCTHFASLIGVLLRQKNIPTRLVSGFQGGEYNNFGKYYIVRSNDAHVWLEFYHDNLWHRFDPTAYIMPERIQLGGQKFINPYPFAYAFNLSKSNFLINNKLVKAYNNAKLYFDNLNVMFNRFFENFNREYQKQLAKLLKINIYSFYSIAFWIPLILVSVFYAFNNYRHLFRSKKELILLEGKFKNKLKKYNIETKPSYTLQHLKSFQEYFTNDNKQYYNNIIDIFISAKYQNDKVDLKHLKRLIKKL